MKVYTYTFESWVEMKEFVEHNLDKLEPGDRIMLLQEEIPGTDLPKDILWMYAGKSETGIALFKTIEVIDGELEALWLRIDETQKEEQ